MYGFARKRRKGYNQDWGRIWVDYRRLTRDEKNSRIAALTSGCPAFQKHAKHAEGSDTSYVSHTRKALSTECENRNFDRNEKRLRSPAGPRRLGTATRISASLFRRLSAFFESTSRPRPKSGKVRRSDTRPGDVRERAARVEGNDSAPTQNATYFGVCALVCDFSRRAECVQAAISTETEKITQPSGTATPRDSDAHERIAVPQALCVLREYPRPRPKRGKVCRSTPWPRRVS